MYLVIQNLFGYSDSLALQYPCPYILIKGKDIHFCQKMDMVPDDAYITCPHLLTFRLNSKLFKNPKVSQLKSKLLLGGTSEANCTIMVTL